MTYHTSLRSVLIQFVHADSNCARQGPFNWCSLKSCKLVSGKCECLLELTVLALIRAKPDGNPAWTWEVSYSEPESKSSIWWAGVSEVACQDYSQCLKTKALPSAKFLASWFWANNPCYSWHYFLILYGFWSNVSFKTLYKKCSQV